MGLGSWLDDAIGVVAPDRMRARKMARLQSMAADRQIERMSTRRWDAARTGRRTSGWMATRTSANAALVYDLRMLRDRSRDLARNSAHAPKALDSWVNNIVGTGVIPRPIARTEALAKQAGALWDEFVATCDVTGQLDFYGLQQLAVRTIAESGEALIRLRPRRLSDGLPVPLQLQLIEPDYLDEKKTERTASGGRIVAGVEHSPIGQRTAYWLFPEHPGDQSLMPGAGGVTSYPVNAAYVLHAYRMLRPEQCRGVPWFAPVLLALRDLDDYRDAELIRKKLEACFVGVVMGSDAQEDPTDETIGPAMVDSDGKLVEKFEPGMVAYARGSDVKFHQPAPSPGYADYMRTAITHIAAGAGLTYELMSGDLSRVNYTSHRAGLNEFRRVVRSLQWHMLVRQVCQPVWQSFVTQAQAAGLLPATETFGAKWTPPRFESVDPLKDVTADQRAVRAGFKPLSTVINEDGEDADATLAEIARVNAILDKYELVLDSDPRRTASAGTVQSAQPDSNTQDGGAPADGADTADGGAPSEGDTTT